MNLFSPRTTMTCAIYRVHNESEGTGLQLVETGLSISNALGRAYDLSEFMPFRQADIDKLVVARAADVHNLRFMPNSKQKKVKNYLVLCRRAFLSFYDSGDAEFCLVRVE